MSTLKLRRKLLVSLILSFTFLQLFLQYQKSHAETPDITKILIKETSPALYENCHEYFNKFLSLNESTIYSSFAFDTNISLDDYIKIKKRNKNLSVEEIEEEYHSNLERTNLVESQLQIQTSITRIFGQCYASNDLQHQQDSLDVGEVEKLLFPWLARDEFNDKGRNMTSVFQNILQNSKGKGITITANNSHYSNLISLIVTLRVLRTSIPIEVIHRGDFPGDKQMKLERLSRFEFNEAYDFLKPILSQPDLNQLNLDSGSQEKFPALDVSFKDISNLITPEYKTQFKSYSNKPLALLFSSFEEVLIMDADIVPFTSPQNFFKYQEYLDTGIYLFRDRELIDRSSPKDVGFWVNLTASHEEQQLFDISTDLQKHINGNRYMRGFTHYVESGVVVWNKKKHFASILQSVQLQLWGVATRRVWGDKEFFWLSLMIQGEDNFAVNQYPAGAFVQKLNFTSLDSEKFDACSVQPVHIYKDSLSWMNSGFQVCKKPASSYRDASYTGINPSDLNKLYGNYVKIEKVIIPPNVDDHYLDNNIEDGNKIKSWQNMRACAAYNYCVKSRVSIDEKDYEGQVFDFTDEQQSIYDYLGMTWSKGIEISMGIADLKE